MLVVRLSCIEVQMIVEEQSYASVSSWQHLFSVDFFGFLGRLPKVDLIIYRGKMSVRPSVTSVRPQKVSSI